MLWYQTTVSPRDVSLFEPSSLSVYFQRNLRKIFRFFCIVYTPQNIKRENARVFGKVVLWWFYVLCVGTTFKMADDVYKFFISQSKAGRKRVLLGQLFEMVVFYLPPVMQNEANMTFWLTPHPPRTLSLLRTAPYNPHVRNLIGLQFLPMPSATHILLMLPHHLNVPISPMTPWNTKWKA